MKNSKIWETKIFCKMHKGICDKYIISKFFLKINIARIFLLTNFFTCCIELKLACLTELAVFAGLYPSLFLHMLWPSHLAKMIYFICAIVTDNFYLRNWFLSFESLSLLLKLPWKLGSVSGQKFRVNFKICCHCIDLTYWHQNLNFGIFWNFMNGVDAL